MANTAKQQEAANQYLKENVEEIKVYVPKGQREIIKEFARQHGESTNSFINRIIREAMKKETQ